MNATAALDVASEQGVIAGLAEATRGKTLIVATHRLALLEIVDAGDLAGGRADRG